MPLVGLCCTNGVRDSLCESSVVAGEHEQLVPYDVQDQELAFVQHGAEAARFAIDLVWSRYDLARGTHRQARAAIRVQRRGDTGLSHDKGVVRHAPSPDDRVRRKPAAVGRP